jgi:hypothetical protein
MFRTWMTSALLLLLAAPGVAVAQSAGDRMSALETALSCAPPPRLAPTTPTNLRLAGSLDVSPRGAFGPRDLLIVSAGTEAGVSVGQRYFVRRANANGAMSSGKYTTAQRATETLGWIRIVSVNDTTSVATVDHACNVMAEGDYLEPFAAAAVPAALASSTAMGPLDFSAPGHIVFGDGERSSIGVGEFALIDRGTKSGTTVGSRFAVYRDLRVADLPLTSVGEAVVISEAEDAAVVRIVRARDAVFSGDYLVPEKK